MTKERISRSNGLREKVGLTELLEIETPTRLMASCIENKITAKQLVDTCFAVRVDFFTVGEHYLP